ncbi:hypothetical protein V6N13_055801 [Hibiscus sabdariffa]
MLFGNSDNKIEAPSNVRYVENTKGESSTVASNTLFVVPRAAKLCSRGQLVQFPASLICLQLIMNNVHNNLRIHQVVNQTHSNLKGYVSRLKCLRQG